ncbi:hypothetical protein K1719_041521 [Acacia pycnantha]|nr:hypothetical protein K1719_041521 [Acacia pycnantha]
MRTPNKRVIKSQRLVFLPQRHDLLCFIISLPIPSTPTPSLLPKQGGTENRRCQSSSQTGTSICCAKIVEDDART